MTKRLPYKEAVKRRPRGACYCDHDDKTCYALGHWSAVPPRAPRGPLTRIHVNGQRLRDNRVREDNGKRNRVFVVNTGHRSVQGTRIKIHGPSQLVYRPENPMDYNGAMVTAWIETRGKVDVYWGRERVL